MRMTATAVLRSPRVTLMLGLLVAGVLSIAPTTAAAPHRCADAHSPAHTRQAPAPPTTARSHHSYLVEARMGWAIG
jgi:hypothetical protein